MINKKIFTTGVLVVLVAVFILVVVTLPFRHSYSASIRTLQEYGTVTLSDSVLVYAPKTQTLKGYKPCKNEIKALSRMVDCPSVKNIYIK